MKIFKSLPIILCFFLIPQLASGFEGGDLFPMKGNVIFPLNPVNVQLSKVNVVMERGEEDSKTNTKSEFIIKNLGDEEINFKVAFPVQSNCINCTKMPSDFRVLVDGKSTQTSIEKMNRDEFELLLKEGVHKNTTRTSENKDEIQLITWNIFLNPHEQRSITCRFTLEWLLDPGVEYLEYILRPIYLWKNNIEDVSVTIKLPTEFIEDIKNPSSAWAKITLRPALYTIKNNTVAWNFRNLRNNKIGFVSIKIDSRRAGSVGD